ncbi:hypothetical protein DRN98_01690 [Methanosarcinales archaeon]|nr:MAG: hypothetical protein DRN98_01690 [Methanosarcinales archaeon]
MHTGLFLCSCAGTIKLSFKDLKKTFGKLDEVCVVETHDLLCHADGLNHITYYIRNFKPDRILIAGCEKKQEIYDDLARTLELPPPKLVDIREACGWVHNKRDGTQKAKGIINLALMEDPEIEGTIQRNVGRSLIMIGGKGVYNLAPSLAKISDVSILTSDPKNLNSLDGIKFYIGEPKAIYGKIGAFEVKFDPNRLDQNHCIECGRCIEVCDDRAILDGMIYSITDACTLCGKCIGVCPADAINLTPESRLIGAGQIILEDESLTTIRSGIHLANEEDPASLVAEVVSNFDTIEKPRYLDHDLTDCASYAHGLSGCTLCTCPNGAITRKPDGKLEIDEISCEGCGLCASLCPLSLLKLTFFPNERVFTMIERLLTGAKDLKPRIILFTDLKAGKKLLDKVGRLRMSYPPILPLFLPSTLALSVEHILRALDAGADGVIILGETGIDQDFIRKCLDGLDLKDRMLITQVFDPDAFTEAITEFSGQLTPSRIRKKKMCELDDFKNRAVFLALIRSLSDKTGKIPELKISSSAFGVATIDSRCTVCDACTAVCPAGALRKEENRIFFRHGECINCRLCEKACPESAIRIEAVLDLSKTIRQEEDELASSKPVKCARCGEVYTTEALYETLKKRLSEQGIDVEPLRYCERCRPLASLEQRMNIKDE